MNVSAPSLSPYLTAGLPARQPVPAGADGGKAVNTDALKADASKTDAAKADAAKTDASQANPSKTDLSPQQLAQVEKLKASDTKVRQHELAHLSAAGGLATSGPTYTYQRGPNGVNYAVGGEVNIDSSPGNTPAETIARARTVQAAALAPADPSGQDRAVAARAQQQEQQARTELALSYQEESKPAATIDTYA